MKSKRWVTTLMLLAGWAAAFGQQTPTKASLMEEAFGAIRAEMVRDACSILEFSDNNAIQLITNKSISRFYNEISSRSKANPDDLQLRCLYLIIGDANHKAGGLGGEELSNYQTRINGFRAGLKEAYFCRLRILYGNNPEILRSKENLINNYDNLYLVEIDNLIKECQDFDKFEAEGRLDLYSGTVFKPLIMENNKRNASLTPMSRSTEQKDDKQDWDDCVKTFDGILDFIKNNPDNRYVSVADEYLWNLVDGNNPGSLQKYLNAGRENAIHKKEAEEMLKALTLDSCLKQCRSLDDYEKVLEQYPDDPVIRDVVYEKCWELCEDRGNDYDYLHYISIIDRFGGSLHYMDAQRKIKGVGYDEAVPQKKDHSIIWLFVLAIVLLPLVLFFFGKKKKLDRKIKCWK